jgi:hypothetical protein
MLSPYENIGVFAYAALRRFDTQAHCPQVQRIDEQSVHTVKSTDP